MAHRLALLLAVAALLLGWTGCVSTHGTHCFDKPGAVARKQALLDAHFEATRFRGRTVFVPKGGLAHPDGAPVVILHEFPALSAEVLDLAARIAERGYSVYVPLMLNGRDSDPAGPLTLFFSFPYVKYCPQWRAGDAAAERPVVDWIARFCNERVAKDHPGRRIGVIGMCLSGIFPIALLDKVPALYAPVVAHPSMPFHLLKSAADHNRAATGLTAEATRRAQFRVAHDQLQILGLRFAGDHFATAERFGTLRDQFGPAFCGLTLPLSEYHRHDGLPADAHSVLGGCYLAASDANPHPATYRAYLEVLAFLDAKLRHSSPRSYRILPSAGHL